MSTRILSVLAPLVFLACSSNGDAGPAVDDSGTFQLDGGTDTATAPDTTPSGDTATAGDTTPLPTDGTPGTGMKCGSATCVGGQECCYDASGAACITTGAACAGARYDCTSKTNCAAGEVCCLDGGGAGGASCTTTCPSTTTCDSAADCSGATKNCVDIGGGVKACRK